MKETGSPEPNGIEAALLEEARKRGQHHKSKTSLANAVDGKRADKLRIATELIDAGRIVVDEETGCRVVG